MNIVLKNIGKEKYFKEVFNKYYAPFVLYAKRFIKNKEVREDIVSNVFIELWNKIKNNEVEKNTIAAYIKFSVRNACFNYLKHLKYENEYAEDFLCRTPIYAPGSDDVFSLEDLYNILFDLLDEMSEEYRDVFIKTYFENKTQQEIADEMNVSVKTVGRYKKYVLSRLQKDIGEYMSVLVLFILIR